MNVHEAKTNLSRLLERARAGEEIVIAKAGKPCVRLVPIGTEAPRRRAGTLKDVVRIEDSFFDPLPRGWSSED